MSSQAVYAGQVIEVVQRRRAKAAYAVIALAGVLAAVAVLSLGTGAMPITASQVVRIFLAEAGIPVDTMTSGREAAVLMTIRFPRVIAAALVGGVLAVSGAVLQGLFRNPLAGPGLIGVSSGAALAVAVSIVLFTGALTMWVLPVVAFLGSALVTLAVYTLATRNGRTDVATMLLAGVAFNSIAGAGTGLMTFLADDAQLRDITFWSLGSLGGITWNTLRFSWPVMVGAMTGPIFLARSLNCVLLGEQDAAHLGVPVQRLKVVSIVCVAAGVGAAVSISGSIGFVGLVAPHLVRLLLGPDHRTLLPASALLGAVLLLSADMFARTIAAPAEVPIGIVTALIGGPFFLWLLVRHRGAGHG